jgi:hypothetical protein
MRRRLQMCAAGVVMCLIAAGAAHAEPLRILVSEFDGPGAVGKYVMTTLFFEVSRAFDAPSGAPKGVWILYGRERLSEQSHRTAIAAATWPSVRSDVVLWGRATPYSDGVVVQSFLTITPLAAQRHVRPHVWSLSVEPPETVRGAAVDVSVGVPRLYYEFEPFVLPGTLVQAYTSPEGIPLFASQTGGAIVDYARGAFYYVAFASEGVLLRSSRGVEGWARLPPLPKKSSHAIAFAKGAIRVLRGDWPGAIPALQEVLADPTVPRALEIDARLLLGLANEQLGGSGLSPFEQAYALNRLDRTAASYVIMGTLSQIGQARRRGDAAAAQAGWRTLARFAQETSALFPPNDRWFGDVRRLFPASQ